MIEENGLFAVGSVEDKDKIRVVNKNGLSQSIEVGNLKKSLLINGLPDRVSTLETKANTNDEAHTSMSSDIDLLKLAVGKRVVEDGTVTEVSGLFREISNIRSEIASIEIGEVDRLDDELDDIRERLISIDGTNGELDQIAGTGGRLAVLEGNVERLVSTKLDQSAFQNAVDAGFKMIRKTPDSASAEGKPGEVYWDDTHVYVCVATDTWKRIPLESESW